MEFQEKSKARTSINKYMGVKFLMDIHKFYCGTTVIKKLLAMLKYCQKSMKMEGKVA